MADLARFVTAQDGGVYSQALSELREVQKRSHWMWFVFPQIAGLGRSETARFYAIANLDEATAYLAHPVLAPRLAECAEAMLAWAGRKSIQAILGNIDSLKFASSMTLFEAAAKSPRPFAAALDAFCAGARDKATLDRL